MQGYNAPAVIDDGRVVLAAEITKRTVDRSQLGPMISELDRADVAGRPDAAIADAQ